MIIGVVIGVTLGIIVLRGVPPIGIFLGAFLGAGFSSISTVSKSVFSWAKGWLGEPACYIVGLLVMYFALFFYLPFTGIARYSKRQSRLKKLQNN